MFTRIFIAASCLVSTLSAIPAPQKPLALAELVNIALENHPTTHQAWWSARRAAAAVGVAKSSYFPTVGLDAEIENGRDFKFLNGPDVDYTIVGANLTLSMLLLDFGERSATVEAAKKSLLAANWQADWNIQKVMVTVLESAYSLLHAQEEMQAAHVTLEDAEKLLLAAQDLNQAGLAPITDVYTSKVSYANAKMELIHQRALADIQRGKLAASIGFSADIPIELAPIGSIQEMPKQQTAQLIELAYSQRADLHAKRANLAEAYARKKIASSGYGPKLYFSGFGGANHAIHDKANAAQYGVSLNLEIPLFSGFETVYNNRLAYAEAKISEEEMAELQLEISNEVLSYSKTLEAAQEMLPDAVDSLNNAVKAYDGVLEKYKAGKERIAEVSNALRQLASARIRYSDVNTRLLIAMANLAYATGTLR